MENVGEGDWESDASYIPCQYFYQYCGKKSSDIRGILLNLAYMRLTKMPLLQRIPKNPPWGLFLLKELNREVTCKYLSVYICYLCRNVLRRNIALKEFLFPNLPLNSYFVFERNQQGKNNNGIALFMLSYYRTNKGTTRCCTVAQYYYT